jgi:hypothetical protein
LRGPEKTAVELSTASMPEQGKRKVRENRLSRARKGKRGGFGAGDATQRKEEGWRTGPGIR